MTANHKGIANLKTQIFTPETDDQAINTLIQKKTLIPLNHKDVLFIQSSNPFLRIWQSNTEAT